MLIKTRRCVSAQYFMSSSGSFNIVYFLVCCVTSRVTLYAAVNLTTVTLMCAVTQMIRARRQRKMKGRQTASFMTRRSPSSTASAASHWTQSQQAGAAVLMRTRVALTLKRLATRCFEEVAGEAMAEGVEDIDHVPSRIRMDRGMLAGCTVVDPLSMDITDA